MIRRTVVLASHFAFLLFAVFGGFLGFADVRLREIAAAIAGSIHRAGDLAARYGGEEFAVILTRCPNDAALALAESLRRAVEERAIPHGASAAAPMVTISIGVGLSDSARGCPCAG